MVSAGGLTALLCADGSAVACGSNIFGQCNIPPLKKGISYTQVSAGGDHLVLLRSDGQAVACGYTGHGQCDIPPLDEGRFYTQVSAGMCHTVLLRNDGHAVVCGNNSHGQCDIPPLVGELTYTQVSAGMQHTILLLSDGCAVACGNSDDDQCDVPFFHEGQSYTQVSAGMFHTVILRSDGSVVAFGNNDHGQCNVPALKEGVSYTQVSAGGDHTVLLRSDGSAAACGMNDDGECNIPALEDEEIHYTQVSAGMCHTVLLRNDGHAVACGLNIEGQCNIPTATAKGYRWQSHMPLGKDLILQLHLEMTSHCGAGFRLICSNLAGDQLHSLNANRSDLASKTLKQIADDLMVHLPNLRVVLPDGQLLGALCEDQPLTTLSECLTLCEQRMLSTSFQVSSFFNPRNVSKNTVYYTPHIHPTVRLCKLRCTWSIMVQWYGVFLHLFCLSCSVTLGTKKTCDTQVYCLAVPDLICI